MKRYEMLRRWGRRARPLRRWRSLGGRPMLQVGLMRESQVGRKMRLRRKLRLMRKLKFRRKRRLRRKLKPRSKIKLKPRKLQPQGKQRLRLRRRVRLRRTVVLGAAAVQLHPKRGTLQERKTRESRQEKDRIRQMPC